MIYRLFDFNTTHLLCASQNRRIVLVGTREEHHRKKLLETVVTMADLLYHKHGDVITIMTYDQYISHYGCARVIIHLVCAKS